VQSSMSVRILSRDVQLAAGELPIGSPLEDWENIWASPLGQALPHPASSPDAQEAQAATRAYKTKRRRSTVEPARCPALATPTITIPSPWQAAFPSTVYITVAARRNAYRQSRGYGVTTFRLAMLADWPGYDNGLRSNVTALGAMSEIASQFCLEALAAKYVRVEHVVRQLSP
jgi:hypothetical protein